MARKRTRDEAKDDKANALGIRPLGNLLFDPEAASIRSNGLGSLARLPDELLLVLFSTFDAVELVRIGACSKACYAWSRIEGIWKVLYILETNGRLAHWRGSWRASYASAVSRSPHANKDDRTRARPEEVTVIRAPVCSDVLFQPILCAQFDPSSIAFTETIKHVPAGADLTPDSLPNHPVILAQEATANWKAREWTLDSLVDRFPDVHWRAEATLALLRDYAAYERDCAQDESPLYLFDSHFVEKTDGQMGDEYSVLPCFGDDLFSLLRDQRPDYRWLIMGAERSGSTWHRDPNHTSAWNAVVRGSKLWLCFPPSVTPPGVRVSADESEVECPLSLAEWFQGYWRETVAMYGPKAKDPRMRNVLQVGVCREGETFCVPSRWWHLVINLEPSIAITQNYVGRKELKDVLDFMRDRPDQVSGFRSRGGHASGSGGAIDCDEIVEGVYELFKERVVTGRPDLAHIVKEHERVQDEEEASFSFAFAVDEE